MNHIPSMSLFRVRNGRMGQQRIGMLVSPGAPIMRTEASVIDAEEGPGQTRSDLPVLTTHPTRISGRLLPNRKYTQMIAAGPMGCLGGHAIDRGVDSKVSGRAAEQSAHHRRTPV
jgi:hypothetical protein